MTRFRAVNVLLGYNASDGMMLLHAAACGRHTNLVKFLLQNGVDPNSRLKHTCETPLGLFMRDGGTTDHAVWTTLNACGAIDHRHSLHDGRGAY